MSKRKCEEHGALEVHWDSVDIPDKDGKPRCWVCDIEAENTMLRHACRFAKSHIKHGSQKKALSVLRQALEKRYD